MAEGRHRVPKTTLGDVITGAVEVVRSIADIPKERRTQHLNDHWGDTDPEYEGQRPHYRRGSAAPAPGRDQNDPFGLNG